MMQGSASVLQWKEPKQARPSWEEVREYVRIVMEAQIARIELRK